MWGWGAALRGWISRLPPEDTELFFGVALDSGQRVFDLVEKVLCKHEGSTECGMSTAEGLSVRINAGALSARGCPTCLLKLARCRQTYLF